MKYKKEIIKKKLISKILCFYLSFMYNLEEDKSINNRYYPIDDSITILQYEYEKNNSLFGHNFHENDGFNYAAYMNAPIHGAEDNLGVSGFIDIKRTINQGPIDDNNSICELKDKNNKKSSDVDGLKTNTWKKGILRIEHLNFGNLIPNNPAYRIEENFDSNQNTVFSDGLEVISEKIIKPTNQGSISNSKDEKIIFLINQNIEKSKFDSDQKNIVEKDVFKLISPNCLTFFILEVLRNIQET